MITGLKICIAERIAEKGQVLARQADVDQEKAPHRFTAASVLALPVCRAHEN